MAATTLMDREEPSAAASGLPSMMVTTPLIFGGGFDMSTVNRYQVCDGLSKGALLENTVPNQVMRASLSSSSTAFLECAAFSLLREAASSSNFFR